MKTKLSIKKVLFSILLVVGIVPVIIMGSYIYENNTKSYTKEFDINIKNNLNLLSHIITNFHEENIKTVNMFKNHPFVEEAVYNSDTKFMVIHAIWDFQRNYSQLCSIYFGVESGKIYTMEEDALPKGYDPRNREWYREGKKAQGDIVITKPYKSAVQGRKNDITYSKAFVVDGQVKGVIGLDVDMDFIRDTVSKVHMNNNEGIFILSEDGYVIADNNSSLLSKISKDGRIIKDIAKVKDGNGKFNIENEEYMYYLDKNKSTGWQIAMVIPAGELKKGLEKTRQLVFFTCLLLIISIFAFSSFLSSVLTKPICELTEVLNNVALGNYDCKVKRKHWLPYEMKMIINTVNNMIKEVNNKRESLQEKNEEITSQNEEILAQNEEIGSLYQQTSAMNESLNELLSELEKGYKETVTCLANAIEASDEYTKGHCERVAKYAVEIARAMGFEKNDLRKIEFAGLLHDIGKIGIPTNVLNKVDKLTDKEFELIKTHPILGYNIVKDVNFLEESAEILYLHHERVDGQGYPRGLKGEEINIFSRILTVADCYDAMTTSRPYRAKPLTQQQALRELRDNIDTQFDRQVTEVFIHLCNKGDIF